MISKAHKADLKEQVLSIGDYLGTNSAELWSEMSKVLDKLEKAYGNCQACYGKGYSTVRRGLIGYPDFPGDKGFKGKPQTKIKFCACARGNALKQLWDAKVPELEV